MEFEHEQVVIRRGPRSGLPIFVAVHSTALGQALGGCRLAHYPDWRDGLSDALRLSAAMSAKCALAGLPNGGGKTVVALPPGGVVLPAGGVALSASGVVLPAGGVALPVGEVGLSPGEVGLSRSELGLSPGEVGLSPSEAAVPPDDVRGWSAAWRPFDRRAVLHDVGDVIAGLSGAYATGPDVGTGPDDMLTIASRTPHVFCRPESAGGSGDSSIHTAAGVLAALKAVCASRFGSPDLSSRSFAVLGLGRVGSQLLQMLAAHGARSLLASDIDPSRRPLARAAGAVWTSPEDCLTANVDVLIPAALGGVLTPKSVPHLRCAAVAGPANNQLDAPSTADLLHQRGILWAPDIVVSAGGIIHATAVELYKESPARVSARIEAIADTLTAILQTALLDGITPAEAAHNRARQRIEAAPR